MTSLDLKSLRLVGWVLSVLALAFIPNSASALTPSTDFNAYYAHTNGRFNFGCNMVVSESGYGVLANRGSLFQSAPLVDTIYPCGYVYDDGQMDYHTSETYTRSWGGSSNSWISDYTYSWNYPNLINNSLQESSYLGGNYHTRLYSINALNPTDYNFITTHGVSGEVQYNDFIFVGLNVDSGSFNPSVFDISFEYLFKGQSEMSDQEKETLYNDIFSHSITGYGSPKDYLDDNIYATIKSDYGITNEADWENNNFYYFLAFLPTYDYSWAYDGSVNIYCGEKCDSVYPSTLSFDPVFGIPQSEGAYTHSYIGLSNVYNNTDDKVSTFNNMSALHFKCLTTACKTEYNTIASSVAELHNQNWTGWIDSAQNPGQSWFSVFGFNVLYPFQSLFTSFTNDRCVDIPIIASWINAPENRYCTWWSNDIRNTLTPIFSSISVLLLFGFIMSWLKGSSSNAFRDNDTSRIGDRF